MLINAQHAQGLIIIKLFEETLES